MNEKIQDFDRTRNLIEFDVKETFWKIKPRFFLQMLLILVNSRILDRP